MVEREVKSTDERFDALDERVDQLAADLDEVKADVAVLKTDVAVLKTDMIQVKRDLVGVIVGQEQLRQEVNAIRGDLTRLEQRTAAGFDELRGMMSGLLEQSRAMTSAMMEAVTQLNLSRNYDRRLRRLEQHVFGREGE
jgi:chromosome segregation ATPase